jgi:hypothetical protein
MPDCRNCQRPMRALCDAVSEHTGGGYEQLAAGLRTTGRDCCGGDRNRGYTMLLQYDRLPLGTELASAQDNSARPQTNANATPRCYG